MTLSIEVLPAPFGPMMARISPRAMSNDTSVNALTPPNDSETFSTERMLGARSSPSPFSWRVGVGDTGTEPVEAEPHPALPEDGEGEGAGAPAFSALMRPSRARP